MNSEVLERIARALEVANELKNRELIEIERLTKRKYENY